MHVPSFLADEHVSFETFVHPPAFTAAKRARFLQIPGSQIAKCVLLGGPGSNGYVLAILPATHQIDLAPIAACLEGPMRLAGRDEIPEVFRDCEWGALAPFGKLYGLPTLLDTSFTADSLLVFEAQFHSCAIRMHCRDFERLEKPQRLSFARQQMTVGLAS